MSHVIEQSVEAGVYKLTVLKEGGEAYKFHYTDTTRAHVLRTLNKWAGDPELSFSWYDAAVASQRVRSVNPTPEPRPEPLLATEARDELSVKHGAEIAQLEAEQALEMRALLQRQQEERDDQETGR